MDPERTGAVAAVRATYLIESYLPLAEAAEVIASEQSTGTFVRVAGETDALRERFRARVVAIEEEDADPGAPALPGALGADGADPVLHRGRLTLDFPLANFGASVPNLLAAAAGNLFELRELAAVRLLDLELPPAFAAAYPGRRFGVAGTRRLIGAGSGVLVGSIVKPSVGLSPAETAGLVGELARAGADFVKDDELTASPSHSPLAERVAAVMPEVERAADERGKKLMYAFNITDEIDRLRQNHDTVVSAGGTCVMVCVNTVGLAGLAYLRSFAEVPIHGHRAGLGALGRCPRLGIGFRAWQKLARVCGADHLHANGPGNKFYESDAEALACIGDLREPLFGGDCLPVVSSGQWAGTAAATYERVGSDDLLVLGGGGVHAHPEGAGAGILALRQGWEAATAGVPLAEYAADRPPLRRAIERFGGR
ncbi:MAG: ribulose 1,5-bisphosphate carboxylase [Actinobacteria bacterium]|nr:ribulose 1,5-bisphosphate carboxylase [Actinomycetota bacterium]